MKLAGHQPQYFPRLHYFQRMLDVDVFEVSDYLQFVKKHAYPLPDGSFRRGKSYQAHTVIKLVTGIYYLAVPAPDTLLSINTVAPTYNEPWADKHLKTLETAYGKSPNFKQFFPEIVTLLQTKYTSMADLNIKTTLWGMYRLFSDTPISQDAYTVASCNDMLAGQKTFRLRRIALASETNILPPDKGGANDWIIALCRHFGADEYIHGGTSNQAYMDLDKIHAAGIRTVVQDWHCREYHQQFPQTGFVPDLSILDLVFNADLPARQSVMKGNSQSL